MKKKVSSFVFVISVGALFLYLIGANWRNYVSIIQTVANASQGGSQENVKDSMTTILKDSFRYRRGFIDAYGMSKKILGERIIGDYEFVKDESGIMQLVQSKLSYDNYLSSIRSLSETLAESNTPFIYLNLPDRGKNFSAADTMNYSGKKYDEVLSQIREMDIDEFDLTEKMIDSSAIAFDEFFFHTDVHLSSKAEFAMADLLTQYLTEKYSIFFPHTEEVYDSDKYQWKDYEFCGNLCNSSGRLFAGTDVFQTFEPKFETHMKLTIPGDNIIKEGTFRDVMTKNYDNLGGSPYWIINYGQYPKPLYYYDNLLCPEGPRLMIICDSMFMRMNTFLALNASHITIVDPRQANGIDYAANCLNNEQYDAVIIGDTGLLNNVSFGQKIDIPDTTKPYQQSGYGGMWVDYVNNNLLTVTAISKTLYQNSDMVTLSGWAADFSVGQPLLRMYVKLGTHLLECEYGEERTSVSDAFKNPNLKKTGFKVVFPKEYLEGVNKIEFIQVGNDGTYRFETVSYNIVEQ